MNSQVAIILVFLASLIFPSFSFHLRPFILLFLGLMMFFLSAKIKIGDLKEVFLYPKALLVIMIINFLFMPLLAYVISLPFNNTEITTGFVLLGLSSMAVATSFWTYISKGNVNLSVGYTTISSIIVVFWIPLTIPFFVPGILINTSDILISLFLSVVFPLILGNLIRKIWSGFEKLMSFSIVPMLFLIYASVGSSSQAIFQNKFVLLAAFIQPAAGFILGYIIAKKLKIDLTSSMFSLGIKNMAIPLAIGVTYFSDLVALPSAATIPAQIIFPIIFVWLLEKRRKAWR